MTTTCTWDVFATVDGFASADPQRLVLGATTFREFVAVMGPRTGELRDDLDPVFAGADDFDLELLDSRVLDGHIQELTYGPTLH